MKAEIEQILQADETAQRTMETARIEAQRIREEARREAEFMMVQNEKEVTQSVTAEVGHIVEEARSGRDRVREEADCYLKGLREKKEAVWPELIRELLEKVTRF